MRVALDDFGTGYSSLTYLHQFAIDCIKIDKSFVDNVARDKQSAIIVASVTKLASSLGMGVVAEGVETDNQREVLTAAGCGALQGYRFGRPMPPGEAKTMVEAARGDEPLPAASGARRAFLLLRDRTASVPLTWRPRRARRPAGLAAELT